ncbi:MAG: nucleoside monophosphate kinase [Patescibacteria group bacterium]|nr:nucleoside monophosphate kinase [Patescibacteria group bacterium]
MIDVFVKEAKDTSTLLPTEVVMALIEKAVKDNQGKSVIIDGFPRSKEQVAMALRMQKDFEAKKVPSVFVEINCPEEILIRRYIDRRVCPICQTPRNIKLLLTKEIEFDEKSGEFHLICERPECKRARFIQKQGDQDGIGKVKERQKKVQEMIDEIKKQTPHLHIAVHNAVALEEAHKHDMADFTEEAELFWDKDKKEVVKKFKPMVAIDEHGRKVHSRWPEPVVVEMVDKLVTWLDLKNK